GLVRDGRVEPFGAERAQPVDCALQVLRGNVARRVDRVHTEQREGARVDGRRTRVRHRIAEQGEQLPHQETSSTWAPRVRKRSKKPGKETSAHSAPEIRVGESAASAATEKASAMR